MLFAGPVHHRHQKELLGLREDRRYEESSVGLGLPVQCDRSVVTRRGIVVNG